MFVRVCVCVCVHTFVCNHVVVCVGLFLCDGYSICIEWTYDSVHLRNMCLPLYIHCASSCSLSDIHTVLNNAFATYNPIYPRNTSLVGLSGWVGCHSYNVCTGQKD